MSNQQEQPDVQPNSAIVEELPVNTVDEGHLLEEDDMVAPELSVAELTQKLAQSEKNAQDNWDKMMRTQAEMENLKRRVDKDLEATRKFALERFAKELINVVDSLELGIQASSGDAPEIVKLREGNELTLKQFEATLARFNIVAVESTGLLNPELHQAVSTIPNADVPSNTILTVFQKGYSLNDRLLRPAMVVVSKAMDKPPENTPKIDEQA